MTASWHIQLGDVATWVSGMATALAVIVALSGVWFGSRQNRRAERLRCLALATGVSAEVSTTKQGPTVTVRNATAAPIFNCALHYGRTDDEGGLQWSHGSAETIGAGAEKEHLVAGQLSPPYIEVGFTDTEGRHWVRRWTGTLIRVPLIPPGSITLPGPQGFEIAEYLDPKPLGIEKPTDVVKKVEAWTQEHHVFSVRRAKRRRSKGKVPEPD